MSLLRSKLTLVSSKLKAGENTFVLFLLILSWDLFSLSIASLLYLDQEYYFKMFLQCPSLMMLWCTRRFGSVCLIWIPFGWNWTSANSPGTQWIAPQFMEPDKTWPETSFSSPCLKCVCHGHGVLSTVWSSHQGSSHAKPDWGTET